MRTFETHEPISLTLELGVGDVLIAASERDEAVVDVQPSDPAEASDVAAARETQVEFANGTLSVRQPKGRRWTPWGGHGSIDVRIELPVDSAVRGSVGVAALRGTGRLGACRFHSGTGEIVLEETGPAELKTGMGDVTVEVIGGRADVKTAGAVSIGRIDGAAAIKNSNGDTWIGEIGGEAQVNAANGSISVDLARAGIVAKTANGNVRLDEVARGAVVAQSAFGTVEVGVRSGIPAWLDLETRFGRVRNDLDAVDPPEPGEEAVEIRAHTSAGNITIRRSSTSGVGSEQP